MFARRIYLSALAAFVIAAFSFLYWPNGRSDSAPHIDAIEVGTGENTLLLVEPALFSDDYRSESHLRAALDNYLSRAKELGWINETTIVVFPEHVATWLVAMDAPALAYRSDIFSEAALALIFDKPVGFLKSLRRSHEVDGVAAALFRSRSAEMAAAYVDIFSTLAREYGVTIAAGSIALENPVIENGVIKTRSGSIQNVSAIFQVDGTIAGPLVVKRHLIPEERAFMRDGDRAIPVFATPAGRLGVLICADAWHPDLYEELRSQAVEIIVAPSFLSEDSAWTNPWRGYVTPKPADVNELDPSALTEGAAWLKYSLPGRIVQAGAKAGGAPFLRGDLWDLGSDGRTLAFTNGEIFSGEKRDGGAITLVRY